MLRPIEILTTETPDRDFCLACGPCDHQAAWDDFRAFVLFTDFIQFVPEYFMSTKEWAEAAYYEAEFAELFNEWIKGSLISGLN